MSSGRFAEVRTPLILSILMVLMTQVGYLDLMNAWSGDEETLDQTSNMPDERDASLSSGSSTTNILNGYQLSAKGLHSCSILDNGSLMCWGLNNRGQIGIGTTTNAHTPQWVDLGSGTNVTQVANGYRHTCAMLENGSLMCWGENSDGQLGNGQSYNTQTTPLWVDLGAGRTATRIDAGEENTCAIADNGSLYCWGDNSNAMLNENPSLLPRQFTPRWIDLGGHTPSSISVGNMNVCAILNNGSLYCWGNDDYGQLARGSVTGSESWDPLYVDFGTGVTVAQIDLGNQHLCAIVDNGSLYCWGRNNYGQLGNGSGGSSNPSTGTPSWVDLGTGRTAVSVSAGDASTCAIVDNGSLYCWGANNFGQIGIGTTGGTPYSPQWVDLGVGRTAVAVSTGTSHTCATLDNGSISCWGSDYSGALGNGAGASDSSSPGIISGGSNWSTSNGSNSGGSSSNYALTPSAEGAELLVGQAMTNITFEYDTGAANGTSNGIPSNGTYNGNGTAWKVSTVHAAGLGKVGNTLYFKGNDGTNGFELWKSDGTDSGTEMVKDINSGQGWGMQWTGRFTPVGVGNEVYFAATDGTNGNELWKTDGTASGTVMVKNINDGSVYPNNQDSLTTSHHVCHEPRKSCLELNNEFYFSATNATNGTELWKSDGTASGTVMVKDIATQYSYSSGGPSNMVVFNNTLYFSADDGTNGIELWKSDGTASGTVMVKDINPYYGWGTEDSRPSDFVVMNDTLYFQAHTNSNGRELWKTDGTATGTVMVKDIRSGSSSSVEGNIQQRQMTLFNNTLYFQADDGTNGKELWKSDGTASGTVMVKNIRVGSASSGSTELAWFTGVGDRLYFWADDGGGHDLWKTDGTASGTVKIKDFTFDPAGSSEPTPNLQAVIGNILYFVVDDGTTASNPGVYGSEVWKTDGTSSGTVRVTDINTGSGNAGDSHPREFTVIGTTLYFTAWDGSTNSTGLAINHVWALDPANITGLASSITNVTGASCSISPSLPTGLSIDSNTCTISGTPTVASSNTTYTVTAVISGVTYQTTVWLSSLNRQLTPSVEGADLLIDEAMTNITFHYDANAASGSSSGSIVGPYNGNGTAWMVKDFTPSTSDGSSPSCLRAFEDTLYFAGNWGTKVLWKTDGTESGTVKVQDSVNYNPPSNPCDLTVFDNSLYFRAQGSSNGYELWKSDGTASGTVLVKDIRSGSSSSSPNGFRAVGDTLYFYADDGTHGYELWKTDGTASGTVMVKDINSGSGHSSNSQGIIPSFVAIGDTIYFIANDGINGRELWKSDGTASGTVMVKNIRSGSYGSYPQNTNLQQSSAVVGNTLYFTADDGTNGRELWKSDGTSAGTVMVKDICSGCTTHYIGSLAVLGNTVYFSADDGTNGRELWKTDGTSSGTVMVKDIWNGSDGGTPWAMLAVGNTLYFTAYTAATSQALWKSDGTASGTVMVKDINTVSANPSYITEMTPIGNTIYFNANDGIHGSELWKSDGTASGTVLVQDIKTGGANYGSGPQWFEVVGTTLYFRADDGGGFELWALDPANIMFGSSVAGATCSISPSLPAGLSIDSSTCTISGTPTAETSNTTYTVTAVMSGVTYQTTVWLSSAYQQLTPSVEGADLFLDVPMTDITFHYNASTATTTAIGNVNGQITTLGNGSTWMVADLYSGTCQSRTGSSPMIRMSYQIGDVHYFDACGGGDAELWAHNTSNGTLWAVTDINTVGDSNVGGYLDVLIGDTLYFSAYDGSGYHLWAHDASNHSTWKAIDSDSNSAVTVYPGHGLIAVDGDVFYFSGQLSNGMELLAYNTSNESVWEAADIKSGSGASNPVSLLSSYYPYSGGSPILSDDVFVFYAGTSSSDRELWAYNISNASAWQVYDINSGSSYSSFPEYIAHVNDVVYFAAECTNNQCNPSRTGRELYAYNATNQSTWLVLDIRVGTDSSHPGMYMPDGRDALIIDDTFYFDASTGANGKELWAHNTSNQTTWLVADINSAGDAKPGFYTQAFIHDGRLYFDADDGIKGRELWVYDPSNDSSWRLTDIAPGSGSSIEKSFGVFGDVFYFGADDGSSGRDLWAYDSSNGSSWLVANPNNQYDSNPERGILIGNTIYFSALEQATGYELYAYQPAEITSSGSSGSCSISPSLPAGLSIDSSTCTISGTPTVETSNTTYTVTAVISNVTYQGSVWLSTSTFGTITSAVEGAALNLGEAMTPITLNYTSQAPSTSLTSGNDTAWYLPPTTGSQSTVNACRFPSVRAMTDHHLVECSNGVEILDFTTGKRTTLTTNAWPQYITIDWSVELDDTVYYMFGNDSMYAYDETTRSLDFVVTLPNSVSSQRPQELGIQNNIQPTVFNGNVYWHVLSGNTYQIWKSDGTASGTGAFVDLGSSSFIGLQNLPIVFNGELVFINYAPNTTSAALYASDGTISGTRVASNSSLIPHGFYNAIINPNRVIFENELYWLSGTSLRKTDGTTNGTVTVSTCTSNSNGYPFAHNGAIYWVGKDCTGTNNFGAELYKYDGTNTTLVGDFVSGSGGLTNTYNGYYLNTFRVWNDTHFAVRGDHPTYQNALYITDGASYIVLDDAGEYNLPNRRSNTHGSSSIGSVVYYGVVHTHGVDWCSKDFTDIRANPVNGSSPTEVCFGIRTGQSQSAHGYMSSFTLNDDTLLLSMWPRAGGIPSGGGYQYYSYAPNNITLPTPPPVSWETHPALPAGMSISGGTISGTPSVYAKNQTYTIYANQSGYSTTHELYFSVDTNNPHTVVENQAIDPIGFHPPFWNGTTVWSVSPALPGNLSINTSTGEITGSVNGTLADTAYTVTATHNGSATETFSFNLRSLADYDGDGLPNDLPGDYDAAEGPTPGLVADSDDDGDGLDDSVETGTGNYVDGTDTGTNPLNPDTDGDGICDGPNAVPGVCVAGPDADPNGAVPPPTLVGVNNTAISTLSPYLTVSGGTYEISPTLPASLTLDANTGEISGTPTQTLANTTFTVWANHSDGTSLSWDFTIEILEDSDGDGLPNQLPGDYDSSNPDSPGLVEDLDDDADGLPDTDEGDTGTSPTNPDTDGDGMCDGINAVPGVCTAGPDAFPLDPSADTDTDGDGMPDTIDGDSTSVPPLVEDEDDDGDGLDDVNETGTGTYVDESDTGTDPLDPDTDNDGICDGPNAVPPICVAGPDETPLGQTAEGTIYALNNSLMVSLTPKYTIPDGTYEIHPALPAGVTIDPVSGIISGTPTEVIPETEYTVYGNATAGGLFFTFNLQVLEDTDRDGLPNELPEGYPEDGELVEDLDDDGDGASDLSETGTGIYNGTGDLGTDSLNPDTDGDGICDGPNAVPPICLAGPDSNPVGTGPLGPTVLVNNTETTPINPPNAVPGATWEVSPDLPEGLVLDPATGIITGTPTQAMDNTTYTIWANTTDPAFSIEATFWLEVLEDFDGDGLPDELPDDYPDTGVEPYTLIEDEDDDNDGLSDTNESIIGTNPFNPDTDGDGFCDGDLGVEGVCYAGPDSHPLDPTLPVNTDGDAYPDEDPDGPGGLIADDDDDNDGYLDTTEVTCESDPLNATSIPDDMDGDGICDLMDDDMDGDGIPNEDELGLPIDTSSTNPDSDGDGVCDGPEAPANGGCVAGPDAFPLDPAGAKDTDGDGKPDQLVPGVTSTSQPPLVEDLDDDDDTWSDADELACGTSSPTDAASVPVDTDGDGICDALDPYLDLPFTLEYPTQYVDLFVNRTMDPLLPWVNGSGDVVSWELEGELPEGLTFGWSPARDATMDGSIRGTPVNASATVNLTVWANNSFYSESFALSLTVFNDSDNDSLPDQLPEGYVGNLTEDTDDDNDGLSDSQEAECGSDPMDAESGTETWLTVCLESGGDGQEEDGPNWMWCFPCLLFLLLLLIIPLLLGRDRLLVMLSDGPEPENTFAEPDFTAGSGTEDDPFILAPVGPLQPGAMESTVEEITITNMGDIRVDMFDFNDEENYGRFTMYESAFSMEGSRQLPVGKDGEMVINFKFDDREFPTYEGGTYTGRIKLGKASVYFLWEVTVMADERKAENVKKETMSRIKKRKKDFNFDRIGKATKKDADDLQAIKGIGPYSEEKLNALGIFTYEQLANFDRQTEDEVNDAIEHYKGRIRRDEWVKQAQDIIGAQAKADEEALKAAEEAQAKAEAEAKAAEEAEAAAKAAEEAEAAEKEAAAAAAAAAAVAAEKEAKDAEKKAKAEADKKAKEEAAAKKKAEAEAKKAKAAEEKAAKEAEKKAKAEADKKAKEEAAAAAAAKKAEEEAAAAAAAKKAEEEAKKAKAAEEKAAKEAEKKAKAEADKKAKEEAAAAAAAKKAEEEAKKKAKAEADKKAKEEAAAAKKAEEEAKKAAAATKPASKEEKKKAELKRVMERSKSIDFKVLGTAKASEKDDLQVIKGIGPFIEEKLNALGIYTYLQISKMTAKLEDQVNEAIEFFPGRVKRDQWVNQAKILLGEDVKLDEKALKQAEELERVAAKAEKIDFATLGVASASEKDDLKAIKGIGPFIEEKLNALGIYTFEQVSKMTAKIEEEVNVAIEFFPGRVKRDEWAKQAKTLHKDKK